MGLRQFPFSFVQGRLLTQQKEDTKEIVFFEIFLSTFSPWETL